MLRTIDVKQTFFPLIYFGLKFLMSMFFTGPVRLTYVLTNTCTEIPVINITQRQISNLFPKYICTGIRQSVFKVLLSILEKLRQFYGFRLSQLLQFM